MRLTQAQKLRFKNLTEQVLHVPGNYRGGALEMALVFDMNLSKECAARLSGELVTALKAQNKIFRNVRLNTIKWDGPDSFVKAVTALPYIQMGKFFEGYERRSVQKPLERLTEQLKKYYARSKLILVLTDGAYIVEDQKALQESLEPFLNKKVVIIRVMEEKQDCIFCRNFL